jgi:hypothetical protein
MPKLSSSKIQESPQKFIPLEREGELKLLKNDGTAFSQTKQYLDPLIIQSLNRFELSEKRVNNLHEQLLCDVPRAAKTFMNSKKSMDDSFKFCTYFTWYIGERINKIPDLTRKRQ